MTPSLDTSLAYPQSHCEDPGEMWGRGLSGHSENPSALDCLGIP